MKIECVPQWAMTWRFDVVASEFVADNFLLALLMLWLHMHRVHVCECERSSR